MGQKNDPNRGACKFLSTTNNSPAGNYCDKKMDPTGGYSNSYQPTITLLHVILNLGHKNGPNRGACKFVSNQTNMARQ